MVSELQDEFIESLVVGDKDRTLAVVKTAEARGLSPMTFVSEGFME